MLAYCSILRLGEGHLVYAKGYEQPARHEVRNSGVRITCHALDLQAIPTELLAQIDAIAAVLRVDAPWVTTAREYIDRGPHAIA